MAYIRGMTPDREPQEHTVASTKRYHESRFYALRGVFLLLAGSAILLACKLPLPGIMREIFTLAGGGAILFGNGYILFGLLVFADSRTED